MAQKAGVAKLTLGGLSTEDLSRELQRRQRGLPALYSKLAKAEAKVKRIMSAIQMLGGGTTGAVAAPGRRRGRPPGVRNRLAAGGRAGRKRPKNKTNLVEALAVVLKGKTMGVTEVTAAVQAAGYKTSSANFRTIVNQALIKSDAFKKVSRGQYTTK